MWARLLKDLPARPQFPEPNEADREAIMVYSLFRKNINSQQEKVRNKFFENLHFQKQKNKAEVPSKRQTDVFNNKMFWRVLHALVRLI